jgi:hypothetical protein
MPFDSHEESIKQDLAVDSPFHLLDNMIQKRTKGDIFYNNNLKH